MNRFWKTEEGTEQSVAPSGHAAIPLAVFKSDRLKRKLPVYFKTVVAVTLLFVPANAFSQSMATTGDQIVNEAVEAPFTDLKSNARSKGRNQVCQIRIMDDGALYQAPGTNRLSSFGAGGRPGQAEVFTTHNSFKLTLDPPLGFNISPQNGNNNVSFSAQFSGNGATSFSLAPGTMQQKLQTGQTYVEMHFTADRGSDPFPAGQYQAQLVLRCE